MSGLPYEEWLPLAQALPVGQTCRRWHRTEGRPNLLVSNKPEGWSSWCFACNAGGFKPKEFVRVQPQAEPDRPRQGFPPDYIDIDECEPRVQYRIAVFLARKGLDLHHHLAGIHVGYSAAQDRLVLECWGQRPGVHWLGRALGDRQPKWITYSTVVSGYAEYAMPNPYSPECTVPSVRRYLGPHIDQWLGRPETPATSRSFVVVEDYLSALKVAHAAPHALPVASLGTRLSNSLVELILDSGGPVCIMYDGDQAGARGSSAGARRLRGLGVPVREVRPPAGLDPKDLTIQGIQELLEVS